MQMQTVANSMSEEDRAWNVLAEKPTILKVLAWCATDAEGDVTYSKNDIARGGQVSRSSIGNYVDQLVDLGVLQPTTISRGTQSYTGYYVEIDDPLLDHVAAIERIVTRRTNRRR